MPHKQAVWTDIKGPSAKDIKWLKEKFRIHPVILDELKGPSARSRVEAYDHYLYLIYYFPVYETGEQASRRTEIDFIITKSAVVTVHYEHLKAIEEIGIKTAADSLALAYGIVEGLFDYQERELRHIREKVEEVGRELFQNREREILEKISHIKRDISAYRVVVEHEGPILKSLLTRGAVFWGERARPYLNDLIGDHLKIVNQIDSYREAISDFEDTNNQSMNLRINDVMKTFTILSFLTFPFMLIATIFNMNVGGLPLQGDPNGFWIIFGFMAAGMATLALFFKKKGWF